MRRLTLMLVGTMSMMSAGVFALACSSDPAVIPPGDDDDDDDVSSSGNGSSGASGTTSGGTTSSGGGSTSGGSSSGQGCLHDSLRPDPAKGPRCPFLPRSGSSGIGGNCETGETCCNGRSTGTQGSFDPTVCAGSLEECPAPTNQATETTKLLHAYQCVEKDDCVGGGTGDAGGAAQVCCLIPFPTEGSDPISFDPDGKFTCNQVIGEFGTRCRAACGAGEVQACQSDAECGTGKTCKLGIYGPNAGIQGGYCE